MFGAYGRARLGTSLTFVSDAAVVGRAGAQAEGAEAAGRGREHARAALRKKSMVHNGATPKIEIDPETYAVTADGELLVCEPAETLPMAQRYFLF